MKNLAKNRLIIGLGYRARSGKDTVARMLNDYGFKTIQLKDCIYEVTSAMLNMSCAEVASEEFKHLKHGRMQKTGRCILQQAGDMIITTFGSDYLCKYAEFRINKLPNNDIVIPDIRRIEQVKWLRAINGVYIRIDRPSLSVIQDRHITENELKDYIPDYIIKNTTLDELKETVNNCLEQIRSNSFPF